MAASRLDRPRLGNSDWSLFLRQQRLKDQLRRLRNDFKQCHCPPGCRGGSRDHLGVPVNPESPPAQPLHSPYVPSGSDLPTTWARPDYFRDPKSTVVAEARGTSDIVLHRARTRATLRMSLQVRTDSTGSGRLGYFGEMFLTRLGQPEEFIGFINSWYMDRSTRDEWESLYLGREGRDTYEATDMQSQRSFFQDIFGLFEEDRTRDRNGNLLPIEQYRSHFAAAWARLNADADIVYIPEIWIQNRFQGQRIIDQGFDLFFRLMVGGSLPEPYNITRPLGVMLEAGELEEPYNGDWQDPITGEEISIRDRISAIMRAYERNGFMRLLRPDPRVFMLNRVMGRRIDPEDHPAHPTDTAIVPPNPPDTDVSTPSPVRRRREAAGGLEGGPESRTLASPSLSPGRGGRGGGAGDDDNDDNN